MNEINVLNSNAVVDSIVILQAFLDAENEERLKKCSVYDYPYKPNEKESDR